MLSPSALVQPHPLFLAISAASQIVINDDDSHSEAWFDQDGHEPLEKTVVVNPSALKLVNNFLDQLLFNFLAISKSTSLASLRPAVFEILKPKLAKMAIHQADQELEEYLGRDDDEELASFHNGIDSSGDWDLELVWKRTRLRCMVYSSLGDMEEEDEDYYTELEHLHPTNIYPKLFDVVSPIAAIFLTSILEFMGEQALTVAGRAAYHRMRLKQQKDERDRSSVPENVADRVIVENIDMERVALDRTLGRLWRGWKKRLRSPNASNLQSVDQSYSKDWIQSHPPEHQVPEISHRCHVELEAESPSKSEAISCSTNVPKSSHNGGWDAGVAAGGSAGVGAATHHNRHSRALQEGDDETDLTESAEESQIIASSRVPIGGVLTLGKGRAQSPNSSARSAGVRSKRSASVNFTRSPSSRDPSSDVLSRPLTIGAPDSQRTRKNIPASRGANLIQKTPSGSLTIKASCSLASQVSNDSNIEATVPEVKPVPVPVRSPLRGALRTKLSSEALSVQDTQFAVAPPGSCPKSSLLIPTIQASVQPTWTNQADSAGSETSFARCLTPPRKIMKNASDIAPRYSNALVFLSEFPLGSHSGLSKKDAHLHPALRPAPPPRSAARVRLNAPVGRNAKVMSESGFADFIRSTGPRHSRDDFAVEPPRQTNTSAHRVSAPYVPILVAKSLAATGNRLQARDAVVDSDNLSSSELIDFIRQGPPSEPFTFDQEDIMPKRKIHRFKDPYAIDYSHDEEDDDEFALPKGPPKRAGESLIDFLNSDPPPDTSMNSIFDEFSAILPKKTVMARFSRSNSATSSSSTLTRRSMLARNSSLLHNASASLTRHSPISAGQFAWLLPSSLGSRS